MAKPIRDIYTPRGSFKPALRSWLYRYSGASLVVLLHLLWALLSLEVGQINSPYLFLVLLLQFFAIWWFGLHGFGLSVVWTSSIMALLFSSGPVLLSLKNLEMLVNISLPLAVSVVFYTLLRQFDNERHQLLAATKEATIERQRLFSLINNMADGVLATDQTGQIMIYNAAALDLLNTNLGLERRRLQDVLQLQDKAERAVDIIALAQQQGGKLVRDDLRYRIDEGGDLRLYIAAVPIHLSPSQQGENGFVIVLRDITKQKSLEEQRDEFISVTSHELRTPVAIAEANIATVLLPKFTRELGQDSRGLLKSAHDSILFLATLVNDLYVLAKAEGGELQSQTGPVEPQAFLESLQRDYGSQAASKGLDLELAIDLGLTAIETYPDGLRELMQNFITNALKYTPAGSVALLAMADTDTGGVIFGVRDSGIGISKTDQKHVFEKFYRSEDFRTRASSGTGLGLYITRRLAERMGGRVWFDSRLNKGSTFYCSLPPLARTTEAD